MTGPLLVLGVLSAVGGVINLPEFVGGSAWLDHWLAPATGVGAGADRAVGGTVARRPRRS